jgi:hypothetical protein
LARIGEEKWKEIERATEEEKILEKIHTQKALELGNKELFQEIFIVLVQRSLHLRWLVIYSHKHKTLSLSFLGF